MTDASTSMPLQPLLHELQVTLMAPSQIWATADGQIRRGGLAGAYHGDVRVLTETLVRVNGLEPEHLSSHAVSPGVSESAYALRMIDTGTADPTCLLTRRRIVEPGRVGEEITLSCATDAPLEGTLTIDFASDLARTESVKSGLDRPFVTPVAANGGALWADAESSVTVTGDGDGLTVNVGADGARLSAAFRLAPGQPITYRWTAASKISAVVGAPTKATPEWATPSLTATDRRSVTLLRRSLEDLASLRMTANLAPDESFLAAGAPWFYTLFGRDSIIAARFMLPLGTDLARGTLRTLAACQGRTVNHETAEEPGKIMHELRSQSLQGDFGMNLPPMYFGTVDATALWVRLLLDAWRWGLSDDDVRALIPAAEAALTWLTEYGDHNGDGFIDYVDETGHGLSNQGWKDSGDSIQWRDGSLARGPIALSEVQAYAYAAATEGADLLDAFGRPGGDALREWARELAGRFRAQFWLTDDDGPFIAIALDRDGKPIDTVTSNMGHLLGTGILTPDEEGLVAKRLIADDMSSGYGLRTMSSKSGGYWPLKYHAGSVWTHDTAMAILGLARSGFGAEASQLAEGLLAAARHFDFQMPELFSGAPRGPENSPPVPYPASCHPQAWAAASSVAILEAMLGLAPRPDGTLAARAIDGSPLGEVTLEGVRVGTATYRVTAGAAGTTVERLHS